MANWNKNDRARLAQVALRYHSNKDASIALGIGVSAFNRACKRAGIESPNLRIKRQQAEAQARRAARGT